MRNIMKMLTVLGGGGVDYTGYINLLAPLAWFRLRETSGTTAANSGTGGSGYDAANTGVDVGQTGQLGVNEAYTWAAGTDVLEIPSQTAFFNATSWTNAFLLNPTTAGGGNQSSIWQDDNSSRRIRINSANLPVEAFIDTNATDANSITEDNFLVAGTWMWLFVTYNNTTDRTIRIYKCLPDGVLTEAVYGTQTPATGTMVGSSSVMNIGNLVAGTRGFNGKMDEVLFFANRVLAAGEMTQIAALS